jgi:uncharacterized RDD family membrane protein YckC
MSSSGKAKGLLFILAPFCILFVTLFLRVIVGFFSVDGTASANPALAIVIFLLNFIALICVIAMIVLVPWGVIIMVKKEEEKATVGNQILAGRGERWVAKFVDGLITMLPAFIIAIIIAAASGEATEDTPMNTGVFWLVFLAIFAVQAYYLTTQGQTIAKKWLKIRIVDANTHEVGGFVKNVLLRSVVNGVFGFIPFYSLVDALFIFREDRRCVHDLMAGTIVVRATATSAGGRNAKFCTHCGTQIKPNAKFCVSCGTSLK